MVRAHAESRINRARVFLPPPLARSTLILALVVATFIWVFGEAFGQILAGGGTDPNSAPLLALLALAYWPLATAGPVGAVVGPSDGTADCGRMCRSYGS